MDTLAGYMQMGMPTAGDARLFACGQTSLVSWQLAADAGSDAKKAIPTFVDVPDAATHRHRRPWGTS